MASIKRASLLVLGAGALLLPWACGPLVNARYDGEPLYTFHGTLGGTAAEVPLDNPVVRVALFWDRAALDEDLTTDWIEHPHSSVLVHVPDDWTINLYDPPNPQLYTMPWGGQFAVGHLAVYLDSDGDGVKGPNEPFVGGDGNRVVVYVPVDLTADQSPTQAALPQGFHLMDLPILCRSDTPNGIHGTDPDDCQVPLGAYCRTDADCDGGTCLNDLLSFNGQPWPKGSCAVRAEKPSAKSCTPLHGVQVTGTTSSPMMTAGSLPTISAYYIRSCVTQSDCKEEGYPYVCDENAKACVPIALIQLQLGMLTVAPRLCNLTVGDGGMMPMMGDGGMMPPPLDDGGMMPPPMGDGGMMPPMMGDGGCPPPPGQMTAPPRLADGGCPMGPMGDGGMMPPMMDGGRPPPMMDGGMMPMMDGGTASFDAGMPPPPIDGGMPPPPRDGGMPPPPMDAGMMPPMDAGMMSPPDAGMPPPMDAGMPPPMTDGGMMPPPPDDGGMPPPDSGMMPPMMDGGMMPPMMDGGMMPPMMDGGMMPPMMDGGMMPPMDDGGMPLPMDDGGMMPPPDDGGMTPPMDDGGMMPPPMRDGGMMPPPGDGGMCPPRPGQTMGPPHLPDGGCPMGPPPGG